MLNTPKLQVSFRSLELLATELGIDVLGLITKAQHATAQSLVYEGAEAALALLCKSDIVETLLVRAAHAIGSESVYARMSDPRLKSAFMEAHLRAALLNWLEPRAISPAQRALLSRARRLAAGGVGPKRG